MKMLKTQRSKEILVEMDEGELRNLEKCFFVRRNGEIKKKNQREEEGEQCQWRNKKLMEDEAKTKRERQGSGGGGGQNFGPHTLKLIQS